MKPATLAAAEAAKDSLAKSLDGLSALRAIGIAVVGDGFGVKVNLSCEVPPGTVPNDVDGVPVIIAVVGTVRAL